VVAYRSSSKNARKMNLPWAHMELEFDVLGVTRKLVNHVVYLSKKLKLRNIISQKIKVEKYYFSLYKVPKQGILGIIPVLESSHEP
jgi:hypothetical protein